MNQEANVYWLDKDHGYRWATQDENLAWISAVIRTSGLTVKEIQDRTDEYIHYTTIERIMSGFTKKPQFRTINLIARACGYQLEWRRKQ